MEARHIGKRQKMEELTMDVDDCEAGSIGLSISSSDVMLPPPPMSDDHGDDEKVQSISSVDSLHSLDILRASTPSSSASLVDSSSIASVSSGSLSGSSASSSASVSSRVPSASSLSSSASSCENTQAHPGLPYGSVVHFTNHYVRPDLLKPWRVGAPYTSRGTGFHIGERRLITNAHVVRHHTSLRLTRHGQPGNFAGRVLCESEMCDLALVTVDDDDFWNDELAIASFEPSGKVPELDDTVVAVGYPLGAKTVTVTRGVVSNLQMSDLTLKRNNPRQLTIQIDAAINPGNSGGPVFDVKSNQLVGVAFAGMDNVKGHGLVISIPVLQRFLRTFAINADPLFGLLPSLGVKTRELVNPSKRRLAFGITAKSQMPPHRNGIIVNEVVKFGAADGILQCDDVLLSIDGEAISEDGTVQYRGHERLPYDYLVSRHQMQDAVSITLLRKAKETTIGNAPKNASSSSSSSNGMEELKVAVPLDSEPCILPRILSVDYRSSYVLFGGLIFLPAGQPLASYMSPKYDSWGLHVLREIAQTDLCSLDEQALLLSDVLAHPVNVGYDAYRWHRLRAVNGQSVKNMRELASILRDLKNSVPLEAAKVASSGATVDGPPVDMKSNFVEFELLALGQHERIVLDLNLGNDAEKDVLLKHKIPTWCTPELLLEDASRV